MPALRDYAADVYSQFGDDGMIAEVMRRIGVWHAVCVEFGAHDGRSCSNTLRLREQGWKALLMEADPERYGELQRQVSIEKNTVTVQTPVTGENIDTLLIEHGFETPDLMSIDVDGDDYFIFEGLRARPRLVVIEFNCSVPPHMDVRQAAPGGCIGASALATVRLAHQKEYAVIGCNATNLYLVPRPVPESLAEFEAPLAELMAGRTWATIISDYTGRPMVLDPGSSLVWGFVGGLGTPAPDAVVRQDGSDE